MKILNYNDKEGVFTINIGNKNETLTFQSHDIFSNSDWILFKYEKKEENEDSLNSFSVTSLNYSEITFNSGEYTRTIEIDDRGKVRIDYITVDNEDYIAKIEEDTPVEEHLNNPSIKYLSDDGEFFVDNLDKSSEAFKTFYEYEQKYGSLLKDTVGQKRIIMGDAQRKIVERIEAKLDGKSGEVGKLFWPSAIVKDSSGKVYTRFSYEGYFTLEEAKKYINWLKADDSMQVLCAYVDRGCKNSVIYFENNVDFVGKVHYEPEAPKGLGKKNN